MTTLTRAPFLFVVPFCSVVVLGSCVSLCVGDERTPTGRTIDELIAQLGDTSFAVREAASKRLTEREDAAPALRRALKSRDPEVARRAKEILDSLASGERKRAFAAFADAAKRGAVDEAVERFARREK